ncbi:MAG: HEAT repeat domain-containing protein [Candidatus Omnitrophota bacterium]
MYNYYEGYIFIIDLILLGAVLFIAVLIIFYALFKEFFYIKKGNVLLKVKKHVYELILANPRKEAGVYSNVRVNLTPKQFLDAITNKNRDIVFFNESEKQLLKNFFLSKEKIVKIEKIARFSRNKWRRIEAILSLGYAGVDSNMGLFRKAVLSRDQDLAYFSIIALGQIKSMPSAKILLEALKKQPSLRYKIISVLQEFPVDIVNDVIELINDSNPGVRLWALRLLSKFKTARHIDKLIGLIKDENNEVRAAVCDCIGLSGKKDAKDTLVNCLKDNSWLVREHAVSALSNLLGGDSIPLIIELINDGSLSVLASIREVFAKNIEAALPYIKNLFNGQDEFAKRLSIEAIDDSGYMPRLLQLILSGTSVEKMGTLKLINDIIKARGHFSIETALNSFTPEEGRIILEEISGLDKAFIEHVEKKRRKEIKEL